jgi:hypothetical protein
VVVSDVREKFEHLKEVKIAATAAAATRRSLL